MELRVYLKVCEVCGCLWYRTQMETRVYCSSCCEKLKEFPTPQSRKRRGRPRKVNLPTVFAVAVPLHSPDITGTEAARNQERPFTWGNSGQQSSERAQLVGQCFSSDIHPRHREEAGMRTLQAAKNLDSVKGTGFSPYISPTKSIGALAPEGCLPSKPEGAPFAFLALPASSCLTASLAGGVQ
jgi:hypothetical protein